MIKLMVMEFSIIWMVPSMRDNGLMIFNMEKAKKLGQIKRFMKESIKMARKTERVNFIGVMEHSMREIL